MKIIETSELVKDYNGLKAVDHVSVDVSGGEIFGLLGPNGAGKTTLLSMLVTMRRPTSGSASVNGFDISSEPGKVRKSIGVVFQDPSLDEELTAYENLELHAAMYGEKEDLNKRIGEVVSLVGLEDRLHGIVKTFSGGMRRRLEIARGLLHRPAVLFLDEPTLGLDPQTRAAIWEYIRKLKKEYGMTIVMTTHYMEEADHICDRVAIIDHGKIIALDTPVKLKDSLGGDTITVETPKAKQLAAELEKEGVAECSRHDGKVTFCVKAGEKRIPEVVGLAKDKHIGVISVVLHKPTLDDVFLHYTGKTIREENGTARDSIRMRRRAMHR
ncbi:ATP-binding cassette domain-containing protein [Candidatus Micrarchaeota archaeon]|nr:ATP-binding cassette domain-containing protein [Candidatus Micrarchaeota archaeon]